MLHDYSEKRLLKSNLKKTKTLIFQTQNGKSTSDKSSFFKMELQLIRAHSTVTLALLSTQVEVLKIAKQFGLKKPGDQKLLLNVILTLINYLSLRVRNYLILYFFSFVYTDLKFGEFYDNMNIKKLEKDPVERLHTQFQKYFLGLNNRAPNVVARNETGRLSLKLNILLRIIKFWIHLESLPENSIAKQCLIM